LGGSPVPSLSDPKPPGGKNRPGEKKKGRDQIGRKGNEGLFITEGGEGKERRENQPWWTAGGHLCG